MGADRLRLAALVGVALSLGFASAAQPQAVPRGQVPDGPTNSIPSATVTRLTAPAYTLPAMGYPVRIINTTRTVIVCKVFLGELYGGEYAIGPGAQFQFPVAKAEEAISLVCPSVRNGAPLTNAQPGKRYIFRRKPVLPGGVLRIGEIDFNEVI